MFYLLAAKGDRTIIIGFTENAVVTVLDHLNDNHWKFTYSTMEFYVEQKIKKNEIYCYSIDANTPLTKYP